MNKVDVDENGFKIKPIDLFGMTTREVLDESHMVREGQWVIIIKTVPVDEMVRPRLYGIYWALPYERDGKVGVKNEKGEYEHTKNAHIVGVDEYGRQCCHVYTPTEVKIFPDEYTIISEERLEEYKSLGWYIKETNAKVEQPLNLKIIEEGRSLTEEEREIIMALMLDGLTEQQACEEYFLTHHTETQNVSVCYMPNPEVACELRSVFGNR